MTSSSIPSNGGNASPRDQLIDAHPQAACIRQVLSSAYRAQSLRHKYGLDALSFVLGPMAPLGFSMVDEHRSNQNRRCREALEQLLSQMGASPADRQIYRLLLNDYPGRDPVIAEQLRRRLDQAA